MGIGIGPIVVLAVVAAYVGGHRAQTMHARFFRRAGFAIMAVGGGFFGLFLVGETLSDPGGWKGIGLVALWGVPLCAMGLLAWVRPHAAGWVFAPLTVAVVGLSIWSAVDPTGWRSFENHNGPIRAVIVFVVAVALALWGLRRTLPAGVMLLVVGVLPIVISTAGSRGGTASLAAASSAPVVTGLLYVASAFAGRRRSPPQARSPSEPSKAA